MTNFQARLLPYIPGVCFPETVQFLLNTDFGELQYFKHGILEARIGVSLDP